MESEVQQITTRVRASNLKQASERPVEEVQKRSETHLVINERVGVVQIESIGIFRPSQTQEEQEKKTQDFLDVDKGKVVGGKKKSVVAETSEVLRRLGLEPTLRRDSSEIALTRLLIS